MCLLLLGCGSSPGLSGHRECVCVLSLSRFRGTLTIFFGISKCRHLFCAFLHSPKSTTTVCVLFHYLNIGPYFLLLLLFFDFYTDFIFSGALWENNCKCMDYPLCWMCTWWSCSVPFSDRSLSGGKNSLCNKCCWDNSIATCKRMNLSPNLQLTGLWVQWDYWCSVTQGCASNVTVYKSPLKNQINLNAYLILYAKINPN